MEIKSNIVVYKITGFLVNSLGTPTERCKLHDWYLTLDLSTFERHTSNDILNGFVCIGATEFFISNKNDKMEKEVFLENNLLKDNIIITKSKVVSSLSCIDYHEAKFIICSVLDKSIFYEILKCPRIKDTQDVRNSTILPPWIHKRYCVDTKELFQFFNTVFLYDEGYNVLHI